MFAVNLTLRSGDGAPQLTRFLSDNLLQDAHRDLFRDRDPNEIPDLSEVELEIKSHWGDNRVPVFDITFRANSRRVLWMIHLRKA